MLPNVHSSVLALATSPNLDPNFTYEVVLEGNSRVCLIVGWMEGAFSAQTIIILEITTPTPAGVVIKLSTPPSRVLPKPISLAEACVIHKVNTVAIELAKMLNFHLNGS